MKQNYIWIVIAAALGGLMFGFDIGIVGGALPFLKEHFQMNEIQSGWATSCLLLGAIAGAYFAGTLADKYGRKKALLYIALIFGISSILTGLAFNFSTFILFRILGGFSVGAVSVISPMYLSEMASAQHRGKLVSLYQLAITLGILLSFAINYLLHDIGDWNWRWMFISGFFPSLLFYALLFLVPESPRWLMMNNKSKEANAIIQKYFHGNESQFSNTIAEEHIRKINWKNKNEQLLLFIGMGLAVLVQFSGVNTVIEYAPTILQSAGWKIDGALISTFGIGLANVVFTILGVMIIDKVGRRNLYLVGSMGMAICLALMTYLYAYDNFNGAKALALLIIFIAFFATCIGTSFWTLVAEIFPNPIRGNAMSMTSLVNWCATFIVVFFFPWLIKTIGSGKTFGFITAMAILQFVFSYFFLKETKGQTLEEIKLH
jgi:sugar porter (SP) family MFS transporter